MIFGSADLHITFIGSCDIAVVSSHIIHTPIPHFNLALALHDLCLEVGTFIVKLLDVAFVFNLLTSDEIA